MKPPLLISLLIYLVIVFLLDLFPPEKPNLLPPDDPTFESLVPEFYLG